MNGCYFYGVFISGDTGLAVINLVFFKVIYVSYEIKKSYIAAFFIGRSLFNEHVDICGLLSTSGKSGNVVPVAAFRDNVPNELMEGCIA